MPVAARTLRIGRRDFSIGARTYVMGILNLTPDSFSMDGLWGKDPAMAEEIAVRMVEEGADLLDIGAESTRPGSVPLDAETEIARLLPALRRIRAAVDVPLSVDTYKSAVAEVALAEGADMINDISGLREDPRMAHLAAKAGVPVVLMHRRPFDDPYPGDVWEDVRAILRRSLAVAEAAGIPRDRIILDPGFGFGKTDAQNLQISVDLERLRHEFGCPTLLGPSRKSTIGRILGLPVDQRLEGTAAVVALAVAGGVDFIRVHDVGRMIRVVRVAEAARAAVRERSKSAVR